MNLVNLFSKSVKVKTGEGEGNLEDLSPLSPYALEDREMFVLGDLSITFVIDKILVSETEDPDSEFVTASNNEEDESFEIPATEPIIDDDVDMLQDITPFEDDTEDILANEAIKEIIQSLGDEKSAGSVTLGVEEEGSVENSIEKFPVAATSCDDETEEERTAEQLRDSVTPDLDEALFNPDPGMYREIAKEEIQLSNNDQFHTSDQHRECSVVTPDLDESLFPSDSELDRDNAEEDHHTSHQQQTQILYTREEMEFGATQPIGQPIDTRAFRKRQTEKKPKTVELNAFEETQDHQDFAEPPHKKSCFMAETEPLKLENPDIFDLNSQPPEQNDDTNMETQVILRSTQSQSQNRILKSDDEDDEDDEAIHVSGI